MSDRVKVGTSKVTFRVRAFDYPQIELASVEVDVPMYTKTDNKLDNMQQGHVTADVPDGFNEKVKDALHVFADTLQASFNEEGERNVEKHRFQNNALPVYRQGWYLSDCGVRREGTG